MKARLKLLSSELRNVRKRRRQRVVLSCRTLFAMSVFALLVGAILPFPFALTWFLVPFMVIGGLLMLFTVLLSPFGIALL